MAIHFSNTPVQGARTQSVIPPFHGGADSVDSDNNNTHPLDNRPLLLVGHAAATKGEVAKFVDGFKLGVYAKLKEATGRGSLTGDVLRAAEDLQSAIEYAEEKMSRHGIATGGPSDVELLRVASEASTSANKLAANLQSWLDKHVNANGLPKGADRETVLQAKDMLKSVTGLIETLTSGATESQLRDQFLGKALPPGFPIDAVPQLKGMILEHAAKQAVNSAKNPNTFLRGADVTAYMSVVKSKVQAHFAAQIDVARTNSAQNARAEAKEHPELVGLKSTGLLENDTVRAAVAKDYQAMITSILGSTTESAKQTAKDLPEPLLESTRAVKKALDQAVRDGKLTAQEAASAIRLLVVNNFFLRSINPAITTSFKDNDEAMQEHLNYRTNGLAVILQQHANGVEFASKQPKLADLDQTLLGEKMKVNAFIDELVAQL